MIILAVDTCDSKGSVAVRMAGSLAALQRHETTEDFSSWLLTAVEKCLKEAGLSLKDADLFAVASGPGSFTGLRVGLTTAKAWAELYGKKIVGVSRLEVMAGLAGENAGYVAASFDAQRGQIFGGLYWMNEGREGKVIEQEMVIAADEFVKWVGERSGEEGVRWVGLDPDLLTVTASWENRAARGEVVLRCPDGLAAGVAELAEKRAQRGEFTDALRLDANYVRRSDAEIFWRDPGSHERGKDGDASIRIREFRGEQDAEAAAEVLRESPEAAVWSEQELRDLPSLEGVSAFISERGGVLSGVVAGRRVLDEAEILNLAVRREARRQGEGGKLVLRLLEEFRASRVSRVFLEVRKSNKQAIAFYEKLGFRPVAERKDYYQNPREPAIVMEAWLK